MFKCCVWNSPIAKIGITLRQVDGFPRKWFLIIFGFCLETEGCEKHMLSFTFFRKKRRDRIRRTYCVFSRHNYIFCFVSGSQHPDTSFDFRQVRKFSSCHSLDLWWFEIREAGTVVVFEVNNLINWSRGGQECSLHLTGRIFIIPWLICREWLVFVCSIAVNHCLSRNKMFSSRQWLKWTWILIHQCLVHMMVTRGKAARTTLKWTWKCADWKDRTPLTF